MAESFEFHAGVEWRGEKLCETFVGKENENRGIMSPAPEFKGMEGTWNPEDMVCAALASCNLFTFLSFVRKNEIHLVRFQNHVTGFLTKGKDGFSFTKFIISLDITVEEGHKEKAIEAVHLSERFCLVSNSLSGEKELKFEVREEPVT